MPKRTQDITFNVTGQSVTERVVEGQPDSATFKVFADTETDDATARFSGSATVDTVDTTVDAGSGPTQTDAHRLNVASTTGMQTKRKYLVQEESMQEWVEILRIVTDQYVLVRHPLKNDYTSAATVKGATLSAAVDAAWVADSGNISDQENPLPDWRVRWLIDMPTGPDLVYVTFFDLVRVPIQTGLTMADLDLRFAGLVDKIGEDYDSEQGIPLIGESWRALKAELAVRVDVNDAALRDDERLRECHILKALQLVGESGLHPAQFAAAEYADLTKTNFERYFEAAYLLAPKNAIATGTGGGASTPSAQPFWRR